MTTPVRMLQIARQQEIRQAELTLAQIDNALRRLEVEREMLLQQAQQALRKELLPLEQVPLIADAAARVWQGANVSIYGENAPLLTTLSPLAEVLGRALRTHDTANGAQPGAD